jgi:hypothetical protein
MKRNKSTYPAKDVDLGESTIPSGPSAEELFRLDAQKPKDRSTTQPLLKGDCLVDANRGCSFSVWKDKAKIGTSAVDQRMVDKMFRKASR